MSPLMWLTLAGTRSALKYFCRLGLRLSLKLKLVAELVYRADVLSMAVLMNENRQ